MISYARIFSIYAKLYLKSVQNITVRQEYQSVLLFFNLYNFKDYYSNFLINSSKAWVVNFNNGNDNWNNKSNDNYVRCVR